MVAINAYPDDALGGYTVEFRDQQHRHRTYTVTLPTKDLLKMARDANVAGTNDAGRAAIEEVCRLAKRAKEEYLRRMR